MGSSAEIIKKTFFQIRSTCNEILDIFRFSRNEILISCVLLVLNVFARGVAFFNLKYSVDDYHHSLNLLSGSYDFVIAQGRFFAVVLYKMLGLIGVGSQESALMNSFFSLLAYIAVSIFILRAWRVSDRFSAIVIGSLVTLHPYVGEVFSFNILTMTISYALVLCFSGLLLLRSERVLTKTIGVIFISLSLAIYQVVFGYVSIVVIVLIMQRIYEHTTVKQMCFEILKVVKAIVFPLFVSLLIYFVLNFIVQKFYAGILVSRSGFINISEIFQRFVLVKRLFVLMYFQNEPFFPWTTKLFILCIYGLSLVSIFMMNRKKIPLAILKTTLFLIFLFILLLMPAGLIIPLTDWWPVPRVLSGAGIVLASGIVLVHQGKIKKVCNVLVVLIIVSFIGVANSICYDQALMNIRDRSHIEGIISAIDENRNIKKIALIGVRWNYALQVKTAYMDMNISAFGPAWSKYNSIMHYAGKRIEVASDAEIKDIEAYLKSNKIELRDFSRIVINDTLVVGL